MEAHETDNWRNLPNTGRMAEDQALDLVVMSPQNILAIPLLEYGEVVVGRSQAVDVPLSDPDVSRCHTRLTILPGHLTAEDLDSDSGTYLRDDRLTARQPVGFLMGEPIRIGQTVLLVRRRMVRTELRRIWSPAEFATLVEDECLRQRRRPTPFAVAHLVLDGSQPPLPDLMAQVDHALPPPHMIGEAAGAGGLQALLVAVPPMLIRACLRRLMSRLRERGHSARLGLAWFPTDAPSAWALRSLARMRALRDLPDHLSSSPR